MGITHTADCILGLITTEELDGLGQLMLKQLKNRWGDISFYRRFVVGINRAKMQIYELEETAQRGMTGNSAANTASFSNSSRDDDTLPFDKTAFGQGSKKTLFSAGGIS
jgi:hypothetical protein